ncbi:MAG: hypothetical protein GC203_00250 [Phenylobacterium sp.]|uniref:helix-turn-helix transcriptional regulator n=1 Tax=Phenylobacterium sp. TaxID=1871053 RepID=UPI0025D85EED|nr:helix-turn-helix transcriptional regulator [Phenylobacterium sp.]MBI1196274.1 hypothetical protein [Phenylobacterium sp.]
MSQAQAGGSVQQIVAELYRGVVAQPFETFKERALAQLRAAIPFDSAVWGSGIFSTNAMLSVAMVDFPPAAVMAYANAWQGRDHFRDAAAAQPGKALRPEDLMDREAFERTPMYEAYLKPSGVEHMLGVAQHNAVTNLGDMIVLFRADRSSPFSDDERDLFEQLSIHLPNAWQLAQVAQHARAMADGSVIGLGDTESCAVTDRQGLLHAAGMDFCLAVRAVSPNWLGPRLPAALDRLHDGEATTVDLGPYEFKLCRGPDRNLLWAIPRGRTLSLTPAELRAARLYAGGMIQAEIAARLNVSASTVRNQLASAYQKLGVHSKVELVRALNRPAPAQDAKPK